MCRKSGFSPSLSMSVLKGVKYLPTVSTRPDESLSSYTLWIRPLPYVLDSRQSIPEPHTTAVSCA